MPARNIYVRPKDLKTYDQIVNKSEFVHQAIKALKAKEKV